TFTSIIFVFELTGDYKAILPLMLAAVLADIVASALLHDSLMTEKLSRRGLRVHAEYEVDPLRTVWVRDLMSAHFSDDELVAGSGEGDLVTVRSDDLGIVALQRILEEDLDHVLVVDEGHIVGICTPADILRARTHRLDHERVQRGWLQRRAR
ncbi:MAG: hypothetical protein QOK06_360, partial [Acidimicrobiaceae bacterium]